MSAVAEIQPMFFDEEDNDKLDIHFDPKEFAPVTPYSDDLHDEYEAAQEQLRQLRQQEEQLQRQAAELEELSQKEDQFRNGREDIRERLGEYLTLLEHEKIEAERLAAECADAHERFESHLASINALCPETWSRADRKAELARAISYIDSAEDEIEKQLPLIDSFSGKKRTFFSRKPARQESSGGSDRDFLYWLKSGFAFSIPVLGFAIVVLLVLLIL